MSEHTEPKRPATKSKTDLRRGQYTPGIDVPKKSLAPYRQAATSRDEEAMLFGELPPSEEATSP